MRYERFEQLPAWQASVDLAVEIFAMTSKPAFRGQRSLRDQMERAVVSVSNNIAEGFERGTNQGLLTFLYISRGSAGEVRSMLCLLQRMLAFRDLESEILNLKSRVESISRQLGAGIRSLQDSDMKGRAMLRKRLGVLPRCGMGEIRLPVSKSNHAVTEIIGEKETLFVPKDKPCGADVCYAK